jgi:hypothetical protein
MSRVLTGEGDQRAGNLRRIIATLIVMLACACSYHSSEAAGLFDDSGTPATSQTRPAEAKPPSTQPALAGESGPRLGAPSRAEQAAALKVIRELFKADYSKSAPAGRLALAERQIQTAADSGTDPASQYVLLREARDNAVAAGDPNVALAAVDAMTGRFAVDAAPLVAETLTALERQSRSRQVALAVTDAALDAMEKDAAADRFDVLARLSPVAERAAAKAGSPELKKQVQVRLRELSELREAFESAEAARRLLSKKPDDPDANTILGKYLWLRKNDWPGAMPHLARGSDAELKALAAADLSVPPVIDAQTAVARGEAWWQYASGQTGLTKISAERCALHWYQQPEVAADVLAKLLAEKRIPQAELDATAYAASHQTGIVVDPMLAELRRQSIDKAPTRPLDGSDFKGDVIIPPSATPYAISDTIKIDGPATITVLGGTEIRGGVLDLGGKGHLVAKAENGRPVIFRHVVFYQDLGSSLEAQGAVFDDCEFKKGGAWYSAYSSKWTFTSCVLNKCHFGGLTEVDYGFQIRDSVLASMDLPEIKHPHKEHFDHVTALHQDWNTISGCTFVDCAVPPTVCWCAESSNFFGCKFVSGEPFESDKPWRKLACVRDPIGPAPQTVWDDDMPPRAHVILQNAPAPFPIISPSGLDRTIPELVIEGTGARVLESHLK